jgi:hypothetical protein
MTLSVLFLVAMSQGSTEPVDPAGLTVDPVISGAIYCREADGHIALRLRFILHYRNTSEENIVLPMFSVPSGYELFEGEPAFNSDRIERSVSLKRDDVIDANKLGTSKPDAKLFWTLRPGETASTYWTLWIPVDAAKGTGPSLLGKDHYLRVRMKPWAANRTEGERLRKLWRSYGFLWLEEVRAQPIKLHVEGKPRVDGCRSYVD